MGFFLGWLKVINSQTSLLIGFFSFSNPRAEAKALSRATTKISDVWGVVLAFLGGRMEWGFWKMWFDLQGHFVFDFETWNSPHSTVASAWLGCCKYRWLTSAGCNSDCAAQHQDPDEAPLFFGWIPIKSRDPNGNFYHFIHPMGNIEGKDSTAAAIFCQLPCLSIPQAKP